MNDIRRTILWVIFGFSMVLLWDQWQVHNGKKATFFPAPVQQQAAAASDAPKTAASAAATPAATASTSAQAPAAAPTLPKERFEVSTDVLKLTLDTEGGTLVRSELLKYAETDNSAKNVVLLDDGKDRLYRAQTGVVATKSGDSFPTHATVMAASGPRTLAEGQDEIAVKFTSPEVGGLKLIKTYTLRRGSYEIAVKHELVNTSAAPIVAPQVYLQLDRDGTSPPGGSSFYSTYTGPAVYTEAKKFQKVEFSDIKKGKADFETSSSNGYIAMVQHYFASAWLLPDGVKREISVKAETLNTSVPDCCYQIRTLTPVESIEPGATKAVDATLFMGPLEEKKLEVLAPGMELLKDYGRVTVLAKPLFWLLEKLHSYILNWGWSIVALVLLLKVAFYWLNAKAYASMAKMKAINPRIMEMRERLKDKPQQMQQEMMKIYREEKVNPMGGCFPILIQIPVFIALYTVLLSSVEMRNAPWIFWIHDLSSKDPMYILPIVMTLTTLLQTALNPAPPDPMQAKMMWIMPLAFSVMFFAFPAGLVLYWITNNILSIAQQWIINTRMGVPPQFNLPKFK